MKKLLLVLPVLCLVSGFASALSIIPADGNLYDHLETAGYSDPNNAFHKASESCYKYLKIDGSESSEDKKIYSKCFRDEVNKSSISKADACSWNDGVYAGNMIQFDRVFSKMTLYLETYNYGFTKGKGKLYYMISDHGEGLDTMNAYYLYSYDCKTKKTKKFYEGEGWVQHSKQLLWLDAATSKGYFLKGGTLRGGYDPYTLVQVDFISGKSTKFQLFDENTAQTNGTKKLIKGSFVWSEKLASKLVGFVDNYGIKNLSPLYNVELGNPSIDDITNVRKYGIIGLQDITKGKGIMTITMPGYTITTNIDFNKKTIK